MQQQGRAGSLDGAIDSDTFDVEAPVVEPGRPMGEAAPLNILPASDMGFPFSSARCWSRL